MARVMGLVAAANAALAVVFVGLNQWALQQQLEETFVALALCYGIITIGVNTALAALRRR